MPWLDLTTSGNVAGNPLRFHRSPAPGRSSASAGTGRASRSSRTSRRRMAGPLAHKSATPLPSLKVRCATWRSPPRCAKMQRQDLARVGLAVPLVPGNPVTILQSTTKHGPVLAARLASAHAGWFWTSRRPKRATGKRPYQCRLWLTSFTQDATRAMRTQLLHPRIRRPALPVARLLVKPERRQA